MARIEETRLPGVGIRHDFVTKGGRRIGVITHRVGHRELILYADDDPDATAESMRLEADDSAALAELLGASQVTASVADVRQHVEGLALDWVPIGRDWAAAGRTIGDTELRRRTGVSIVAILRGEVTVPSPEPSEGLNEGDTVVVVGTPEGINRATAELRNG